MASFYKNLKTTTKVEALRRAQLSLIRGSVNSDLLARRGIGGVGKLGEAPKAQTLAPYGLHTPTSGQRLVCGGGEMKFIRKPWQKTPRAL
jgi:CHAT domain-containing protein